MAPNMLQKLIWCIVVIVAAYALLKATFSTSLTADTYVYGNYDSRILVLEKTQEKAANAANDPRDAIYPAPTSVHDETKPYDVLINSYMRSGSSFIGQLLAYRPDTFYWYEPLWNYDSGVYYWGKEHVCTGHTRCGISKNKQLNIERMHAALYNIYTCNFASLIPAVADKMTPIYSGDIWKPYQTCRSQNKPVSYCLKKMEDICKNSTHIATKVVRLTVDNLEYILLNLPHVKVVHLIRDPRAIMNSRITTAWYKLNESPQDMHRRVSTDAKDLCLRMKYDLKAGVKLKQKYGKRFAFVMFEDLQNDLKSKAKMLYSHLGIDQSTITSKLDNIPSILEHEHLVKKKWGDYTNWWRFELSFSAIQVIDSVCENVTSVLGYQTFRNEVKLNNVSNKAFSFSSELLLENLDSNSLYDFPTL